MSLRPLSCRSGPQKFGQIFSAALSDAPRVTFPTDLAANLSVWKPQNALHSV